MRKFTLLILTAIFSIVGANAQRIVGYLPDYRNPSTIQYDKVTDVVFSFLNPNTDGSIRTISGPSTGDPSGNLFSWNSSRFTTAKNKCQQNGVSLWIGVGGADDHEERAARLNSVSGNTNARNKFAKQLIDFAANNGAVGVIIDWEFPKTAGARANHKALILQLNTYRDANHPNVKIGVAVGGEYKNTVNHIQYIDNSFFNTNADKIDEWHIMAYDFPTSYGANHSSLTDGTLSANAWNNKGVPVSKMLLAVPFYARNANRDAINYNQLAGNSANFNNDQSGVWHYNGKATLQAKTDHINNMGGQGVVIWDLGQDRTDQYSLLKVIKDKMDVLCNIKQPNLGPDAGVCNGQTVTLKSGVSAGGGLTFSWKKDGNSIAGSSPDLTVSAAGDYEVTVSNGSCLRTDIIKVVSGSSVTATDGSGCRDQDITLTINNPASGKVYDWYDAASGGTQVGTGNSYVYTPDRDNDGGKTFSFYAEERAAGTQTYDMIHSDISPHANTYSWSTDWSGTTIGAKRAILIDAKKDLTLKSVRVYTKKEVTTEFKITLLRPSDNVELQATPKQTIAAVSGAQSWERNQVDVSLDFTVSTGKYFLVIELLNSGDFTYVGAGTMNDASNGSKAVESGVIEIADHVFTDFGSGFVENQQTDPDWDGYGSIYNLRVETGASTSCGRAEAKAKVETCLDFEELVAEYGVSVVPNPSSDEFTFSRGSLNGDVQLNVLTTAGDVVISESVASSLTFGNELPAGVYVVQVVSNGETISTKVVKQ